MSVFERLTLAKNQFDKSHLPFYGMFAVLSMLDNFQEYLIPKGSDTAHIVFSLLMFLSMISVSVLYLMKLSALTKNVKFIYFFIPYLLYSIYYSIIGLVGLIFLFIPGIIYYYLPIIATLHEKASPFKGSITLFKNAKAFTIFVALYTLFAELFPFLISFYFKNNLNSQIINLGFDLISTLVMMIIAIAVVAYFEEAKTLLEDSN
jgi:membrane-associated HD superfamily phosphohydrolase